LDYPKYHRLIATRQLRDLLLTIGSDASFPRNNMMRYSMHTLYYLFCFVKPRDTHVHVRSLLRPALLLMHALLTTYGSST
jgi:hypothetical protein